MDDRPSLPPSGGVTTEPGLQADSSRLLLHGCRRCPTRPLPCGPDAVHRAGGNRLQPSVVGLSLPRDGPGDLPCADRPVAGGTPRSAGWSGSRRRLAYRRCRPGEAPPAGPHAVGHGRWVTTRSALLEQALVHAETMRAQAKLTCAESQVVYELHESRCSRPSRRWLRPPVPPRSCDSWSAPICLGVDGTPRGPGRDARSPSALPAVSPCPQVPGVSAGRAKPPRRASQPPHAACGSCPETVARGRRRPAARCTVAGP